MKFRVERDVLADAVTWTARTLPTRPPVPVLAGVRIEAAGRRSYSVSRYGLCAVQTVLRTISNGAVADFFVGDAGHVGGDWG